MPTISARSSLIYGDSRTYKSTELMHLAAWVYQTTGRRTRVITTEISSADIYQPYIDAGLIELFFLRMAHKPRSAIRHLIRGEWLIAKSTPQGLVGHWELTTPETWKGVAAYAWEGLTTVSELIMRGLVADGRKINEEVVGSYEEDGFKLGAAARSHYGAVHGDVLFLLTEAPKSLYDVSGGMVEHVFFTAHEAKGEDDTTRQPMYGPATVGKAITNKIAKEVGLMIHTQKYLIRGKNAQTGEPMEREEVRAHFRSHTDPENVQIVWQAGPRTAPSGKVQRMLGEKWPGGFVPLRLEGEGGSGGGGGGSHIADFMRFNEEMRKVAAEELRKMLAPTAQAIK